MKKTALIIVVYNTAEFIVKQVETIRRFCKDAPDIIIIDNSNIPEVSEAILYRIRDLKCIYDKTNSSSGNPSLSHAFAANFAYFKYHKSYDVLFFIDHDLFPVKEFSILEILGNKLIAGMAQTKPSGKTYMWPGCFMISSNVESELVNFNPNSEYGLDTGGNLYILIEKYGKEYCVFFNEHYNENIHFKKIHYNVFSVIADGLFYHWVNGSGWSTSLTKEENLERLSGLMAILEERINHD